MTNPNVNTDIELDVLLRQGTRQKKRRWVRWTLVLLVLGGVAAAGIWYYYQQQRQQGAVVFETETLGRGALKVSITATGNLQPRNQVDIGTGLSGTVTEVLVEANAVVKKGRCWRVWIPTNWKTVLPCQGHPAQCPGQSHQAEAQITQAVAKSRQRR
ncbi:MAG: efflux RND transporter periplasmic adaptor subunit [Thiolinea sp.]